MLQQVHDALWVAEGETVSSSVLPIRPARSSHDWRTVICGVWSQVELNR